MKRTPEPCGTHAAYVRHRKNNEEACTLCKRANTEHSLMLKARRNAFHKENAFDSPSQLELDALVAADPCVIKWERNKRGVLVAVYVNDAHAEGQQAKPRRETQTESYAKRRIKTFPVSCDRGHEFDSWNTIVAPDGSFECRTCTTPQDSSLMAAARTDI